MSLTERTHSFLRLWCTAYASNATMSACSARHFMSLTRRHGCLYWQLYLQTPITTELLIPLPQVFVSHVHGCQNPDCGEPNGYNARQFQDLAGITMMLTIEAEGALVGQWGKRTTTVFQVLQRDTARLQEAERTATHKQQVAKLCCSL
jgi:hypothetical protein